MNSTKSILQKLSATVILLFSVSMFCLAQSGPGGAGDNPDIPRAGIPIDGGLSLLLAAGAGLGAKHLAKKRKEKWKGNENVSNDAKS